METISQISNLSITMFFHATASARKKANKILKLCDDNGTWFEARKNLCRIAKTYFEQIFTASEGSYEPIIDVV